MEESDMKQYRCCFTGHRPEKLRESEPAVKSRLEKEIRTALDSGFTTFITGMARGVDLWAAEIVLAMREREESLPIRLICAVPFEGFEAAWSREWQRRYRRVLEMADFVRYICPAYTPACFRIRNEWMADHSALIIAVFNGESGGTKNMLTYAKRHGIPYHLI